MTSGEFDEVAGTPVPAPVDPVALSEPPHTGDPVVDAALQRLSTVTEASVVDQLALYDAVHRTLQDRLADVEG